MPEAMQKYIKTAMPFLVFKYQLIQKKSLALIWTVSEEFNFVSKSKFKFFKFVQKVNLSLWRRSQ